ncbi:MAG: tetratricopeptide repeat protein [Deltaproteobacteria bacterium]|nr:tetratricopeptide repeat protein [Deltaproteobacteria bacterium]
MGTRLAPVVALVLLACGPARHAPASPAGTGASDDQQEAPRKSISPYAAVAFLEAEMAIASGDAEAAIASLAMALTSEPDEPLIKVRLAEAYMAKGDASKAAGIAQEVLDKEPGFDAALVVMGDILAAGGRFEDAYAYYRRAIEAEPSSTEAYSRLVDLYTKAGDPAAALDVAAQLVEADPLDEEMLLTAADLCLVLGRTEEAFAFMSRYIEAMAVEPMTADRHAAMLELAGEMLSAGETQRSVFLYHTYLGMFPGSVEATAGLVEALAATGDSIAARALLDSMPDAQPDAPASQKLLKADLYLLTGAPSRTLDELNAAFSDLSPTLPGSVKLVWITALAGTMRFDEAVSALTLFEASEDSSRIQAASTVAAALINVWRFEEAWKLLASSGADLALHLESLGLRLALRMMIMRRDDPAFTGKVRLALNASPAGRLVLAEADFWGSSEPDAAALMDALAEIRGEGPGEDVLVDAWALEAVCVIEGLCMAKPTRVLSLTTKIAEARPGDPRLPGLRGMFYLSSGNTVRARVSLEEANSVAPLDPMVKVWLAALVAEVDAERAAALLEAAVMLAPPTYVLHAALEASAAPSG